MKWVLIGLALYFGFNGAIIACALWYVRKHGSPPQAVEQRRVVGARPAAPAPGEGRGGDARGAPDPESRFRIEAFSPLRRERGGRS